MAKLPLYIEGYGDVDFLKFDGNKVKGRISKWVLKENKARQIVWNTNTYPLLRTLTCAY